MCACVYSLGGRRGRSYREVEDVGAIPAWAAREGRHRAPVAAALLVPIVATATFRSCCVPSKPSLGTRVTSTSTLVRRTASRVTSSSSNRVSPTPATSRSMGTAPARRRGASTPDGHLRMRVFLADNRAVANVTSNTDFPLTHALTTGDAFSESPIPASTLSTPRGSPSR